uniref:Uncharacterized protein n=1 Tax=Siphoviridae sp. ctKHH22 TaxID=2825439 RepID=A0A8S5Q152_9CAUD|nr:MAG TPA: hypothetical protein [Siphoviridae sp. ctKHH22]
MIMEEKINIAEILKDKPQGTKLYSLTYGDCFYQEYTGDFGIECQSQNGVQFNLEEYGKYCIDGECILFPSKEMRDWGKFAWKKGDVLVNKDGDVHIIFERFVDDTYYSFVGKYYLWKENNDTEQFCKNERLLTYDFQKAGKDAAQTYISTIEERLGGKLNRETLEIENAHPEYKDGDIVFMKGIKSELFANCIFILRSEYKDGDERAFYYAFYNADDKFTLDEYGNTKVHYSLRLATDSEKQQLFDALAKKGKTWDAEKKAIVDLPKKCEFKAMDWCLMRDKKETWKLCQFSFFDDGDYEAPYNAVGGNWFDECIPYNEETKHLLGTTDEWKGGEG